MRGATRRSIVDGVPGAPLQPMLATTGPLPAGAGLGVRVQMGRRPRDRVGVDGGGTRLYARSGRGDHRRLPGAGRARPRRWAADARARRRGRRARRGRAGPSFRALAERMHVRDPARAARLAATLPVTYMIFDLLPARRRRPDRTLPYAERRAAPGRSWTWPATAGWCRRRSTTAPATMAAAGEYELEGVVAKRRTRCTGPGMRSPDWIKVKLERDRRVRGRRLAARARGALGALLVGVPGRRRRLTFRGRVGGGISAAPSASCCALAPLRDAGVAVRERASRARMRAARSGYGRRWWWR